MLSSPSLGEDPPVGPGPVFSTGRPHCFSLPAQISTPSLKALRGLKEVRLCVLVSVQQIPSSGMAGPSPDHASLFPTPPSAWHIGFGWDPTDGLASHQGSPEPPPRCFLGTPTPSWEWSSAHWASLPSTFMATKSRVFTTWSVFGV